MKSLPPYRHHISIKPQQLSLSSLDVFPTRKVWRRIDAEVNNGDCYYFYLLARSVLQVLLSGVRIKEPVIRIDWSNQ
ncbi:hypothetical protein RRG08_001465 [Elysia crispata]|uniref:Uncharacterized protein n=1 Tax=Elysia crispata TaxID=231223 RepID=A0AAE0ZQI7_9GAST|nr:hypothetical protein RRG08_001465 [Elysia crispata]